MDVTGRCYCGAVQYKVEGDPMFKGQCHCRECQYIAGGSPNMVMGMPDATFSYTKGSPKAFTRADLDNAVTREFCPDCGTHLLAKSAGLPGAVLIKVGTLDDPSVYGQPDMVIFTMDKQTFHHIPSDIPSFERGPGG